MRIKNLIKELKFNGVKNKQKIKVLVAMSGGVDSSVAAALLKKQGREVFGVYLRLADKSGLSRIDAEADEKSAREVAEKLRIEFKVVDARKEFKKKVVDYFLREYKNGRTPNPCVVCNPKIKFAAILKIADKLKFDYVATGHYARVFVIASVAKQSQNLMTGLPRRYAPRNDSKVKLFEALDKTKDQSYFLYGLNQKQLARIIFPLGGYKKKEVREIAKKMKLPVFDRKESRDVCFISGKAEEFLRKNLNLKKGKIVNERGEILGGHQGLPLYTIGQRKGIELGGDGPYYVAEKWLAKNKIVVISGNENPKLFKKTMRVENINWINKPLIFPTEILARIRYGHPAIRAIIALRMDANKIQTNGCEYKVKNKREYVVEFEEAQRAVTPGQSAVFYNKDGEVLGGGVIQ
jgi:tRNA-specific 2-thiouridylase